MDSFVDRLLMIISDVQETLDYHFSPKDAEEILNHTIRKAQVTGKGIGYIPVLFENELKDFVMRTEINKRGCALNV